MTLIAILIYNPVNAKEIQITDLNHGNGFVIIKLNEVKIIDNYTKILHIVNLTNFETNIRILEEQVHKIPMQNNEIIKLTKNARYEFETIMPHHRTKRGLINILGTGMKILSGIKDDDDRQTIEQRPKIAEENSHNSITEINAQIQINTHFNDQINLLTETLNQKIKLVDPYIDKFPRIGIRKKYNS